MDAPNENKAILRMVIINENETIVNYNNKQPTNDNSANKNNFRKCLQMLMMPVNENCIAVMIASSKCK